MNGLMTFNDIVDIVRPIADRYRISKVYLFGSYARKEATSESDFDFLVYGGEHFKLTNIFAFAEEIRKALNKNVDVFEINEVNQNSNFYKNIVKEMVLLE